MHFLIEGAIKHTGNKNYLLEGGGIQFWADGIDSASILEAKLIVNAPRSPFIEGSNIPEFIKNKITGEVDSEFYRMSLILKDFNNPLNSIYVVLSDKNAIPFFDSLMKKYNIPGKIIVRQP